MRTAVTGVEGFLGRHLRVRLKAAGIHEVVPISRRTFSEPELLRAALVGVDAVVHLAGINRDTDVAVELGNLALAEELVAALDDVGAAPVLVYANSIQAGSDSPYGRGKAQAAEVLSCWSGKRDVRFVNLVLPNVFGEGGRPNYNSFVATFCQCLAEGSVPRIEIDRPVELLHAQDVARMIGESFHGPVEGGVVSVPGHHSTVGEVFTELEELSGTYATGSLPDLSSPFRLRLFNTYRSYLFPDWYPRALDEKADERGSFVEVVRAFGGQGQTSFSTTKPGVTRGNHFHLHKVERFVVVKGSARIAVRPVAGGEVRRFDVTGDEPVFIDIPTLHTHNISNTGTSELLTLFWASEIFDPADPDTYSEPVE
jgi:UDP-2-acetamido-2,6-beta-L-arabino-hexul-4-ose reductase